MPVSAPKARARRTAAPRAREQRRSPSSADSLAPALASIFAHELQSPLFAAILTLDTVETRLRKNPRDLPADWLLRKVSSSRRELTRARELLRTLLTATRIEARALATLSTEVDLADLVRKVVERKGPELDFAQTTCVLKLPPGVTVLADPTSLEMVIENLLSNAMKFGAGSPIELRISARRDGTALLYVRDHGPGVPARDRERVFERFVRLDRGSRAPGFGLGLWICREIVTAHRGSISLSTPAGGGCAVSVRLPLR